MKFSVYLSSFVDLETLNHVEHMTWSWISLYCNILGIFPYMRPPVGHIGLIVECCHIGSLVFCHIYDVIFGSCLLCAYFHAVAWLYLSETDPPGPPADLKPKNAHFWNALSSVNYRDSNQSKYLLIQLLELVFSSTDTYVMSVISGLVGYFSVKSWYYSTLQSYMACCLIGTKPSSLLLLSQWLQVQNRWIISKCECCMT